MGRADRVVHGRRVLGTGAKRAGCGSPRTKNQHAVSAPTSRGAGEGRSSGGRTGFGMEQSVAGLPGGGGAASASLRLVAKRQTSGGGGLRIRAYPTNRPGETLCSGAICG